MNDTPETPVPPGLNFRDGTHMCLIYDSDGDRATTIERVLATVLRRDGAVAYFSDGEDMKTLAQALAGAGVDVDAARRSGRFECHAATDVYVENSRFDTARMLDKLRDTYCACRARTAGPVMFSGDMGWALDPGVEGAGELARYEQAVNRVIRTHPFSAICQYDARRFDAEALYAVLKAHPYVIVHDQVVANPLYGPDASPGALARMAA